MKIFFPGWPITGTYLLLVSLLLFILHLLYESPNFSNSLLNIDIIPVSTRLITLFVISFLTACMDVVVFRRKHFLQILGFFALTSLLLIFAKEGVRVAQIMSFYNAPQETIWAFQLNYSGHIDPRFEGWQLTKADVPSGQSVWRSSNFPYVSPSGRYRVVHLPPDEGEGFQILGHQRGEIVCTVNKWIISPEVIYWVFDEKYFIFEHHYSRDDLPKLYITNTHSGKTILLAAAREFRENAYSNLFGAM